MIVRLLDDTTLRNSALSRELALYTNYSDVQPVRVERF